MDAIYRAYDATIDSVNKTERSLVAKINTAGVDRYKSVIEPKGAKLENYRKNPVVLWEHGKDVHRRFTDPIGTNQWITERSGELLAKTRFLDDEFSQQRYEWYRDGVLSAFSIHALPLEGSPPSKEETRARPELKDCTFVYRSWELAEYSGTAVPGNADTLTTDRALLLMQAVERGLWLPDDVLPLIEAKAKQAPPDLIKLAETREAPWIDHEGGIFTVRHIDTSPILTTKDKALAEECLRAMTERRTLERTHLELIQSVRGFADQIRRDQQGFKEEITAYLDLMIHGRV